MPVVAGAIVPHAPLLLPDLESPEVADAAGRVRKAVESLSLDDVDAVVMLSPHAGRLGVYESIAGHLGPFGVPEVHLEAPSDPALRDALGLAVIEGPVDHGIAVPVGLREWPAPVVAVGVAGVAEVAFHVAPRVALVASMNLSAALSDRAPLTEKAGEVKAEERFVAALQRDVGTASLDGLHGSCGGALMDIFARVFRGRGVRVLAHEAPVGVGYLVAEVA